ncbi:hypothetical protein OIV83_001247 [Microbotryomycetes sp. JL201]|nr:hypothetical protein OIV83_001247 [Microbotryomycetes sp. JL201]
MASRLRPSMPVVGHASAASSISSADEKTPSDVEQQQQQIVTDDQLDGVSRIEALYLVVGNGWKLWSLFGSLGLFCYALSLCTNTTYVYLQFATSSFSAHSLLGSISTATSIMKGVGQPFMAKLADVTSRPIAYLFSISCYVLGFAIMAGSSSVRAVAAGEVIYTIGSTGVELLNMVLAADLTPLQWRGVIQGLMASPYIVNAFISGYVTQGVGESGWRWGYEMFCIILPVTIAPMLVILFWADIKATRLGKVSVQLSFKIQLGADDRCKGHRFAQSTKRASTVHHLVQSCVYYFNRIDGFGLLLLGAAWALILLPFTLSSGAEGGWSNASMIAMETVGWVLLIAFGFWERYGSRYPMCPARVYNRTFICCLVIDVLYLLSGMMGLTFYSSWVYAIKDWPLREYNWFLNTLGVSLCLFGIVAGVLMRYTHRYKWLQLFGLCVRAIAMGLTFWAVGENATDVALVWSQILIGIGGGFSVVGSQVASQASVPHHDLATVISLLALWSQLGSAVGSAIATSIWTNKLPGRLQKHLGGILPDAEIAQIFGSITLARTLPVDVRALAIKAYDEVVYYLYLPALILAIVPIAAGLATTNFYLGKQTNAVESKEIQVHDDKDLN